MEDTKKEKDQLLKEIRSERKKINDQLDKMEAELLQEVDVIFQTKLQHIESNIKEVDTKISLLQENLNTVKAAMHENASERYVQVHLANEKTKCASDCLENLDRSCETRRIRLDPCSYSSDPKCNIIGKIIHPQEVKAENIFGEFNVRVDSDKKACWITDMCMCEDGSIAMTDFKNKCIKILNESFEVRASIATNDSPDGICQVGPLVLAVTLINERKVQFISRKEPMMLQQSFKVGDRCRGIAHNDGLIYVCCGGAKERKDEGVGHLEVYTISGVLLTAYYGEMECPGLVTILRSTMEIFVIDRYKGMVIIDNNGSMETMTLKKELSLPYRMCRISGSRFCIAFLDSSKLLLVSCDGKDQEELSLQNSGTAYNNGLCFDSKTSRLVTSLYEGDKIVVYNLKINDMS